MNSALAQRTLASPVGLLRLIGDRFDDERGGVHGIYFPDHKPAPAVSGPEIDSVEGHPLLDRLAEELTAFFAGELRVFTVPLKPTGTPFQLSVWTALRAIPFGQTCSYVDVAHALGKPESVRAVATANARNPLSIVVPCHRVIGSDGALTGYAGGLKAKQFLLDLESRVAGTRRQPSLF
ncbi:MAG: methylated-DNA--[protein]-cysteine S-methyltransferase [Deltaproteobacteria bacterium]|nr:methylated-DNA--[protein]-cysteine S-methyltransferase [Deltaproteobacteria bacterium]